MWKCPACSIPLSFNSSTGLLIIRKRLGLKIAYHWIYRTHIHKQGSINCTPLSILRIYTQARTHKTLKSESHQRIVLMLQSWFWYWIPATWDVTIGGSWVKGIISNNCLSIYNYLKIKSLMKKTHCSVPAASQVLLQVLGMCQWMWKEKILSPTSFRSLFKGSLSPRDTCLRWQITPLNSLSFPAVLLHRRCHQLAFCIIYFLILFIALQSLTRMSALWE